MKIVKSRRRGGEEHLTILFKRHSKCPEGKVLKKTQAWSSTIKDSKQSLLQRNARDKKELKGVTVSQANATTSREWKKVKADGKTIKKYSDPHKVKRTMIWRGFSKITERLYWQSVDYQPTEKMQ